MCYQYLVSRTLPIANGYIGSGTQAIKNGERIIILYKEPAKMTSKLLSPLSSTTAWNPVSFHNVSIFF